MKHGSLFSGIGASELAFQSAGCQLAFMCEIDPYCRKLLSKHFPGVFLHDDATSFASLEPVSVDIVSAGDPCPIRSRCRLGNASASPDFAGYVLAVVARCRPRWVLRENVVSPDVADFAAGLDLLGYDCVVVATDSATYTAQSRKRHFVVGGPSEAMPRFIREVGKRQGPDGAFAPGGGRSAKPQPTAPCIVASTGQSVGVSACLLWEPSQGKLRYLCVDEAERLQGFPRGWTSGFSTGRRFQMLGNAWSVPVASRLAKAIAIADAAYLETTHALPISRQPGNEQRGAAFPTQSTPDGSGAPTVDPRGVSGFGQGPGADASPISEATGQTAPQTVLAALGDANSPTLDPESPIVETVQIKDPEARP